MLIVRQKKRKGPNLKDKLVFVILGLLGILECLFGVAYCLLGAALLGSGDSTGIGTMFSLMGLMGIPIGVFLFFAGLGLLRRKSSGRRLNIALAILAIVGATAGIYAFGAGIALFSVLFTAIGLLRVLYLSSVKAAYF